MLQFYLQVEIYIFIIEIFINFIMLINLKTNIFVISYFNYSLEIMIFISFFFKIRKKNIFYLKF